MFPKLETERLLLREITHDDAEKIFACFSNDKVTRFYGQELLKTIDEARAFVDLFAKNFEENKGIRWGIERKGEEGLIGTIGFNALSLKHRRAEIGYEIHPDYWRKGYVSEAVSKILSFGCETLRLTRIGAVVFIENIASTKLLTRIGFQKEGILKNYMYQDGIPHDTYMYSYISQNN